MSLSWYQSSSHAACLPNPHDATLDSADITPRQGHRLPVVQRLDSSKKFQILSDQVGKLGEQSTPLIGRHVAPWSVKRCSCCSYSIVDVLVGGFVHGADDLLGRRIDDFECFAFGTLDEFVVDEAVAGQCVELGAWREIRTVQWVEFARDRRLELNGGHIE